MSEPTPVDPLAEFTEPRPFTVDIVHVAPAAGGVHVVIETDEVIYVGETGNLRQRLRTHLRGNRGSSVLHKQVGEELDTAGEPASTQQIADWLGKRSVRWQLTDDRLALKAALVARLHPRFNRQIPSGFATKDQTGVPDDTAGPAELRDDDERQDPEPEEFRRGRRRRLAEVIARQGQPDFRRRLIEAYGDRCAITGCDVEAALQAAHISPYDGPATNQVGNGLLLRADLHNLFDRGLHWIDDSYRVRLVDTAAAHYAEYDGQPLHLPIRPADRPDREALRLHRTTMAKILSTC